MATVGSGEFTYDVLDNWAKTPDGWWINRSVTTRSTSTVARNFSSRCNSSRRSD